MRSQRGGKEHSRGWNCRWKGGGEGSELRWELQVAVGLHAVVRTSTETPKHPSLIFPAGDILQAHSSRTRKLTWW